MRRRILLLVLALVVLAVAYVIANCMMSGPSGDDDGLVYDRNWMTEIPERETEFMHGFVVLKAHPLGAFYKASTWRFEQEVFEYESRERTFEVRFPQTGKRASFGYEVRRCSDVPPFDLCLTLSRNPWGGPRRFYGFLDDEDEGRHSRSLRGRRRLTDPLLGQP